MALLTYSWLFDLILIVLTLLSAIYIYFLHVFTYWTKRGVKIVEPDFPFGNFREVFFAKKAIGDAYRDFYEELEGSKLGGLYQIYKPTLLLRDLDLIKQIFVKDAAYFQDRGVFHDEVNDPLSNNLFTIGGNKWKLLRAKLTPTFTSGKMKMMFHTLLEVGDNLKKCINHNIDNCNTVEMNDVLARYSTDVIASVAFGIECNCLTNPDAEFRRHGRGFFQRSLIGKIGMMMNFFAPKLAAILKWGNTPEKVSEFFTKVVDETMEYREKNGVQRNDFMQMLIQLKNDGYVEGDKNWVSESKVKIDMKLVAAQAFVFYLAGFETSSTAMTFALYELAMNRDIQKRLREEIDATVTELPDGKLTYEAMEGMEYLNMVISETLRKYPPFNFLNRECNTAHTLPGSELRIETGVQVVVSVYALHHDPKYYPEPDRFDPERFAKEKHAKRNPYSYLPFGVGPRNCIGNRFGLMQVKVGLFTLLRDYEFSVCGQTPIPLVLDPAGVTMSSVGGMPLTVIPRVS